MSDYPWNLNVFFKILRIVRLYIVAGGALAFSIGALLAILEGGSCDLARVMLGYLVVFFGDLSTHYSNDYFDVEVDKNVKQRTFFASSGVLVDHPKLQTVAKHVSISLMITSIALACITVLFFGVPEEFVIVALIANLLGWIYSAPPLRLNSRGLGEITIAFVTGFIIPSAGYLVVKRRLDPLLFFLSVPFTMYGLVLSLSLEAPDIETDRKGGKWNIAARKGKRFIITTIFALSFLTTLTFLIYNWIIKHSIIDLKILMFFSLIPLVMGLYGFLKTLHKKEDVKVLCFLNVVSLFLFNMLMNGYFLYLI
jgi:1,4-dihydroxy-2-naphthoate octaprenyltransferase